MLTMIIVTLVPLTDLTMQSKVHKPPYAVLVVLLGAASSVVASSKCFAGMKSLFRNNIKQACYDFTKGNMSDVSLEHLCSIDGRKFNADECDTTRAVLSASCGTDIQAITSSCQLQYPELKHPYCVDDPCYLGMVKMLPDSFETRCDAVLDGHQSAFGASNKFKPNLWHSCDRSTARVESTCKCVRQRERKMEDDEKQCLGSIELHFGHRNTEAACYQMLTDGDFLARHRTSLARGCYTNEENIRTACKWKNKLLGYGKCLDNSCYRGLARIYGHDEIPAFCSGVIDGTFAQRHLISKPGLARSCGGKVEELKSACLCLYPAERYPRCSHDECFRGIAGDWGEDIATNCRTLLTGNFTDGSDPECKNELQGLVQEAKWLGLGTYAFQTCGKNLTKMMDACRCALPGVQRTTSNLGESAVTTSSSIRKPATPTASQRSPFKSSINKVPAPTPRRRLPFRPQRKPSTWTRSTTTAERVSSTVSTASIPASTTMTSLPNTTYALPSSSASRSVPVNTTTSSASSTAVSSPDEDLEVKILEEAAAPSKTSSSSKTHAWHDSTRVSDEEDDFVDEAVPTYHTYVWTFVSDKPDAVVTTPDYDFFPTIVTIFRHLKLQLR
ncbi:hypothetical protein L249_6645 [Ophiocordyceps polyrhachis-furcata BCC 54312]|uniref:Uncharacterized protein n=1 Tax=Ophiocordyceps polyrhachis-furcata BCC 54312 TaxID=1330021 RepID=A0A367LJJ1_9HYPO|nr:hypothetical protein L249_6645 [Ophiocordyceps polyrhachis-furcata BCC 54312]